jgi:DNA invertase Pin-like site-specific DNA recombinase
VSGANKREVGAAAPAVAAYIRVSTASQDHAYQRAAIERAARARGELVERWYADVASGSTMERPELQRMRADLARGAVLRVWVWRLDRLTRSGIADTLELVSEVREADVELVSVVDGFMVDEGPIGELVLAVMAWAAQMERTKIHEAQEAARARLALQGRGWGRPELPRTTRDAVLELGSQKTDDGRQRFSIRDIARQLNISKSSVGKYLRTKSRGL